MEQGREVGAMASLPASLSTLDVADEGAKVQILFNSMPRADPDYRGLKLE